METQKNSEFLANVSRYQNGSILLATLQPSFTILHALTMPRDPSPVVGLAWHASSSKQKSDMLATQADDGDLRIWSVSKPPGSDAPRVIRALRRSEIYSLGPKWIAWSKNGRVVQYMDRCVAPKLTQQHPAISFSPIFSFPISVNHNVIHSLTVYANIEKSGPGMSGPNASPTSQSQP